MSTPIITDGTCDWSGGIDSLKVATIADSVLNPNGLNRNQLAKLVNGTVRDGSISPRDGWQKKGNVVSSASLPGLLGQIYQGKTTYVPTTGNPYQIWVVGGHVLKVDSDFVTPPLDLSEVFGISFTSATTKAYLEQAEQFLVIQSGNYNPLTNSGDLPIIWDGGLLYRSNGITGQTVNGGTGPTTYVLNLQDWTSPTAGNSLTFFGVTYPGNIYDKVVIKTTAAANICTAEITSIGSNQFTIKVDTQISSSLNASGSYNFILGFNGNNTSMVSQTQSVALQYTTGGTISSVKNLGGGQFRLTFSPSYYYPGNINDQFLLNINSVPIGRFIVNSINSSSILVDEIFTSGTPVPGVMTFLPLVLSNSTVLLVPGVGSSVSLPVTSATPDGYFGSIGDTVTITNGGTNYGTYMVTGYGGLAPWQEGVGVTFKQTAAGNVTDVFFGTALTLTITATPSTGGNNINQIPSALAMAYYMGRLWYSQGKKLMAGDIVGGPSGTAAYNFADSVLCVTENPLVLGGDGFTMPSGSDNITGLAIPQMINASLGQGLLNIGTANAIFALQVPVTRADWIAADSNNQPQIFVVQQNNGFVNDWSIVGVNGDLWFQSLAPDIRSLLTAVRYFQQWANVSLSSNEDYILSEVNRTLLGFASGMFFDNRLWMTSLPTQTPYGVVHPALIPLDMSTISTLEEQLPPNWEGNSQGLQILQLTTATFSGVQRAFAAVLDDQTAGQFELWELVVNSIGDNGKRITWQATFPGFTWGKIFDLKKLVSAELWLDEIQGIVDILVEYSPDGSGCFYKWIEFQVCNAVDSTQLPSPQSYPVVIFQQGVRRPLCLPLPPLDNANETGRPANILYESQPRITFTGQCRLRGLRLHAEDVKKELYGKDLIQ